MQAPVDEELLLSELKQDDESNIIKDEELVRAIKGAFSALHDGEGGSMHPAAVKPPSARVLSSAYETDGEECSRGEELPLATGVSEAGCDVVTGMQHVDVEEKGELGGGFVMVPHDVAEETMRERKQEREMPTSPVLGSLDDLSNGRSPAPSSTASVDDGAEGTARAATHGAGASHLAPASAGGTGNESVDSSSSVKGWVSLAPSLGAPAECAVTVPPYAQQIRGDSPRMSHISFKRAKDIQVSMM